MTSAKAPPPQRSRISSCSPGKRLVHLLAGTSLAVDLQARVTDEEHAAARACRSRPEIIRFARRAPGFRSAPSAFINSVHRSRLMIVTCRRRPDWRCPGGHDRHPDGGVDRIHRPALPRLSQMRSSVPTRSHPANCSGRPGLPRPRPFPSKRSDGLALRLASMMRHMHSIYLVTLAASSAVMLGGVAAAQTALAFPPPAPGITVGDRMSSTDGGTTRLAMDVYKPPPGREREGPGRWCSSTVPQERSAAAGSTAAGPARAASKGLIGILPDLREGNEAADFRCCSPISSVTPPSMGIDGIAVYAGSGNVYGRVPARRGSRH